jgi:hypothetical protein
MRMYAVQSFSLELRFRFEKIHKLFRIKSKTQQDELHLSWVRDLPLFMLTMPLLSNTGLKFVQEIEAEEIVSSASLLC